MSEKRDMSGIIMTFLMMIIGLAMTPTISDLVLKSTGVVNKSLGYHNLTGAARAICVLVPLFWVILVIAVGVSAIVVWLKET